MTVIFNSIEEFQAQHQHCVATIGKYDGMHLGHQQILQNLLAESRRLELPAVVILSEPQPEEFFAGDRAPSRLSSFWEKVDFLRGFGVDIVFRLHFDKRLSQYAPERFIREILCAGLGIKSLVTGEDFRFGKDRAGDFSLLQDLAVKHDYAVKQVPDFCLLGERISSTLVRHYLQGHDLNKVEQLLGRPYSISGEVVKGRQLGRQLGTPTANVMLNARELSLTGIYTVEVLIRGQVFSGVASIGYRPTVDDDADPLLEVHLLDFDAELYGV
ncbi:MAG: riboflavin biosynthesis protein RibF, partial [Pseudohongiellaceae bacterium]